MDKYWTKVPCKCGKPKCFLSKVCRSCHSKKNIIKLQADGKMKSFVGGVSNPRRLSPFRSLYNMFLNVNKHRKNIVKIELSFDEFLVFTKTSTCYYCGDLITWKPYRTVGGSVAYNLDRKNNKLGYTKDNCVVCCKGCNLLKSHFDMNEFLLRVGKISKNLKLC